MEAIKAVQAKIEAVAQSLDGVILPNGKRARSRTRKCMSKSSALRWGQARERELLLSGPRQTRKEAPTLHAFKDRFLEGYVRANFTKKVLSIYFVET